MKNLFLAIIAILFMSCSNMAEIDTEKMVVRLIPEGSLTIKELDPMYNVGDTVTLYKTTTTYKNSVSIPYKVVVVRKETSK